MSEKDEKDNSKPTAPRPAGNPFQYAGDFARNLVTDYKFQSRANALVNGGKVVAQMVYYGALFLTASAIVMPLGLAACAAGAAIGMAGVAIGFSKTWMSTEALFERTFPRLNPLRHIRQFAQKNIVPKPFAQKILKSRLFNRKRRLSPRKQEVFLAGLTIAGAASAMTFCGVALVAMPAVTLSIPVAIAAFMIVTGPYDIFCGGKTLAQIHKGYKQEKEEKLKVQQMAPGVAPSAQETKAPAVLPTATQAFNAADAEKPAKSVALARLPSGQPRPTV